ncbi:nectin-2-like isoform X1 [Seriola dumerili]|uniref:Si:ch73-22o12.1 n=1 Tax=Seriola dumerili TaxID=41447 RepID=A0A3B4UM43_SERDU|nr:nectin-2-like isoform X1 [Seriola dumerili]
MAKHDARNWHDCTKMIGLLCLVASILTEQAIGRQVEVEPVVESYPGQTVNLRCSFTDATGIQLTMVTWLYEPKEGERINIAVFHPKFEPNYPDSPVKGRVSFSPSPPNLDSPSIQISDVRMTDEGKYICEYATYPIGNEQGVTYLVMLAKPQNSASIVTVDAGTKPVVVARCESVDGRPAAQISWVTTANGNGTTVSKPGVDNTVTVTSEYRLVPTAADNGKDISCVVAHRTQTKPESFPMKLAVQYAPQVTIVGYDNNWYVGRTNVVLTCQATGNPVPLSVQWKTMSGEMPDTVQIRDNELKVLKVDEAVNTTFVCEVKNRIGTSRDQVTVFVREATGQQVEVEPVVLSYPGQTVNLRCSFNDATGIHLTQVMWTYESKDGERIYIAMFHPNFDPNYPDSPVKGRVSFSPSPPNLTSPSIQISDVRMTDKGKYICEYATFPAGIKQGVTSLVMLVTGQQVEVEPLVESYPGQTVNLHCAFTDATGIHLTQVVWIYEPKEGKRINIALFHPKFEPIYPNSPVKGRISFSPSPPNLASPSIQISDVRMTDEGKYICEFATYPIGNEQGVTSLVMLERALK